MNQILKDISAPALIAAIEENLFETFSAFRCWPRIEVNDGPDMLWIASDVPHPVFNGVFRARLDPENVDAAIASAKNRYRSRGVPALWWTGPATRPSNLGKHLEAHGFGYREDNAGMAVDLSALDTEAQTPPDLTIERVSDLEKLEVFCRTLAAGFGHPDYVGDAWISICQCYGLDAHLPLRNYIGWFRGEPVATSMLHLAGGVAGIHNVATIPSARRRGIGAAMTLAALQDGREMGYRVGVLHASEMGLGVYTKIGFREHCRIKLYLWTDGTN